MRIGCSPPRSTTGSPGLTGRCPRCGREPTLARAAATRTNGGIRRTGVTGPSTPWGERARQAGSVTAWRSFRDAGGSRWAWVQVTPLASAEDASEALTGIGERALINLKAEVRLVSESDVPIEPFTRASAVWAREQHTDSRDGPGVVLMLAGAVSDWLIVLCLSGSPAWDWRSASELAAVQAARLPVAHEAVRTFADRAASSSRAAPRASIRPGRGRQ